MQHFIWGPENKILVGDESGIQTCQFRYLGSNRVVHKISNRPARRWRPAASQKYLSFQIGTHFNQNCQKNKIKMIFSIKIQCIFSSQFLSTEITIMIWNIQLGKNKNNCKKVVKKNYWNFIEWLNYRDSFKELDRWRSLGR